MGLTQFLANAEIEFDNVKYSETKHATPVDLENAYIAEVGWFHLDKLNRRNQLGPENKTVDLSLLTDYMKNNMPLNQTTL